MGARSEHALAALALLGAVGCHSSSAAPADAGGGDATTPFSEDAMRAAHTAFQTTYCRAFLKCDPFYFQILFGTTAGCIAADEPVAALLDDYGYGSALTPQSLQACADALDLSTCAAYVRFNYEHVTPDVCHSLRYGTLRDGSACGNDNQCASGLCIAPTDLPRNSCGRCAPKQPKDAPCEFYFGCPEGYACQGSTPGTQTCTSFGDVGQSCGAQRPCHYYLVCDAGKCAEPLPDNACDPAVGCTPVPNFQGCGGTMCVRPLFAKLGQPCGPSNNGIVCSFGGKCTSIAPGATNDAGADAAAAPPDFICTPPIEEGHACNAADQMSFFDNPCKVGVCLHNLCQRTGAAQCSPPPVPP